MNNKRFPVLIGCALLVACASTEYRSSDPVVRVMPTKRYWVKPGTTVDDARTAGQECSREIRQDPRYVAAVNESAEISKKWPGMRKPPDDERRQRAANKASSDIFESCMQGKGYQFVRNGVPIN